MLSEAKSRPESPLETASGGKKIGDKRNKMGDRRCLPDGRQAGEIGATTLLSSACPTVLPARWSSGGVRRAICYLISVFSICYLLSAATCLHSDPLKRLAKKLEKGLRDQPNKKVAVLNFPYHDGSLSSGSSIIQERLTTFLVERGKVEVIERNLLKKILDEMKLETTGIIDAETTKELGKVLGVSGIVTGTLNDIKRNRTEVNARVIHTQTGKILSAGRAKIKRTWTDSPVKPDKPKDKEPDTKIPDDFLGEPLIQLAILLDTSGSMSGLINQTKTHLWKIVNELSSSERDGDNPTVQVALYEYGNDNLSRDEGYLRQILPFTTDLDKVSEDLFSLRTRGGQEYCGTVIMDAVNNLQWDKHTDVYKTIFIAGNEPFTQGPVDFRKAVAEAVKKGVIVNTIFCGRRQQGISSRWEAGADAGNGEYLNIDQWVKVVSIVAPQDAEIQRLGSHLNTTFIPYGVEGKKKYKRQAEQDKVVAEKLAPAAATQRSLFKATKQYSGASWDLANAVAGGQIKLKDVKKEQLPKELQSMSKKELNDYIQKKSNERKEIQNKINTLNKKRRKYVAEKRKEMSAKGEKQTLDYAILNAVKKQAAKKNFKFKE